MFKKRGENVKKSISLKRPRDQELDAPNDVNLVISKLKSTQSRKLVVANTKKLSTKSEDKPIATGINITRGDARAFSSLDVDTERSMDHRAILERNMEIGKKLLSGELKEGYYRGKNAYRPVTNVKEESIAAGKLTGLYGPVRGTGNVRYTMRVDYKPDICKDYKRMGYCGFGDTCIFLHDRSDYKSGWQIEKEWQEEEKKRMDKLRKRSEGVDVSEESCSSDEENAISKVCEICQTPWEEPRNVIITLCNHYFCELCAIKHYGKDPKCFTCGKNTDGIFNAANRTSLIHDLAPIDHHVINNHDEDISNGHKNKESEDHSDSDSDCTHPEE